MPGPLTFVLDLVGEGRDSDRVLCLICRQCTADHGLPFVVVHAVGIGVSLAGLNNAADRHHHEKHR